MTSLAAHPKAGQIPLLGELQHGTVEASLLASLLQHVIKGRVRHFPSGELEFLWKHKDVIIFGMPHSAAVPHELTDVCVREGRVT